MSEQLITLIIALREAQKADQEKSTRGTQAERKLYETLCRCVDCRSHCGVRAV